MDLQLNDKIALVTGSSKGIGEAIVKVLAREGATVVVHGRDSDKAHKVRQDILDSGGRAYVVIADLTSDSEVLVMKEQVQATIGDVNILVNNAGGSSAGEDWSHTLPGTWASTYDRNVLAAVRVTTAFLPEMRSARWGRVLNIASLAGMMPPAKSPDYSAAKAAFIAMSASLSKTVAAEGVTVNTVSPGTIHSAKLDDKFREVASQRGVSIDSPWHEIEKVALRLFAQVPMNRVGTLEEISDTITFLASPRAGYITGSNICLDGGMLPTL